MVCLYNIDTAFKTADNAVNNYLVSRLLDEIILEGNAEEFLMADLSPLRPLAPTLSTSPSNKVIDIHIPIIRNYPTGRKFIRTREGSNSPPQ